jgi:hypothetical protein
MHTAWEKTMERSAPIERRKCVPKDLDDEFDREGFAAFLRSLYPRDTAANVADDVEISDRTVDNYLNLTATPRGPVFARFIKRYGPAFLRAVMPNAPAWLDDATAAEELRQAEENLARVKARIAGRGR